MHTVRIRQLEARYHLPRQALDRRERIDRILHNAVHEMLEHALDRLGLSAIEFICIRQLRAPVHLRLAQPDRDLAVRWSLELASAIKRATERDESDWVVRYGSVVEALADLVYRAGHGDLRRAWAWRQLDLTRGDVAASNRTEAIVAALARHPEAIVPVLRVLARRHQLGALVQQLDTVSWTTLARSALKALGADADRLLDSDDGTLETPRVAGPIAAFLPAALSQSPLVHALETPDIRSQVPRQSWTAIATLVCWDADPALLRRGSEPARSIVRAAHRLLLKGKLASSPSGDPPHAPGDDSGADSACGASDWPGSRPPDDRRTAGAGNETAGQHIAQPAAGSFDSESDSESDSEPRRRNSVAQHSVWPTSIAVAGGGREGEVPRNGRRGDDPRDPALDECPSSEPAPRRVPTQFGGLLFLLHLVGQIELPRRACDSICGGERSFRWVLHQLAMMLMPVTPQDPAALAFAGLTVDDPPPSKDAPPTAAEREQLAGWAEEIIEALRGRFPEPAASEHVLLDRLCRRRAAVLGHPGWIVVFYSLRDVSTEIRRAGLDLDPGFVPWLGAVVKFIYE